MSKVLVISDLQLPFQHQDAIKFLEALKKEYKPDKIVCIGDFMDQHALSDYDTNPNGMSAGDELRLARTFAKDFYKLFPQVKVLTSNHDVRVYKKAHKAGIPTDYLRSYNEWMQTPEGWSFHDKLEIDKVIYIHGHQVSGSNPITMGAVKRFMRSVVFGHWHSKFEISYFGTEDWLLWGMCIGSLIDVRKYAFEYERTNIQKPIIGAAVVTHGCPKLVPMVLKKNHRWDGEIHL